MIIMNAISTHVGALRAWMETNEIDCFIVPTADPHGSEYLPEHWKCREWLTGFTGSAGTAVITLEQAALWTDSRYFLQAAEQLSATPFELMREGEKGTPSVVEWLAGMKNVATVGAPAVMVMLGYGDAFEDDYKFVYTDDPFDIIWSSRPALPGGKIVAQNSEYTALSADEKVKKMLETIPEDGVLLLTDLSEIAWTLNLRGSDIAYNPVFLSYLFLSYEKCVLCVDADKLTASALDVLKQAHVSVRSYADLMPVLSEFSAIKRQFFVYESTNALICNHLKKNKIDFFVQSSQISPLKAVKDECEQAGFRLAMERDGVALVQFCCWFDESLQRGDVLTEQDVDSRLTAFRAAQKGFESLSFATIAASGAHGAIVHYEADPDAATPLPNRGFILLDSGAQYDCGTTDITRTLPLGSLTEEERRVYTLVLKAHIGLARLRFPEGTNGLQVDTAARAPLWQAGYDFGHGTGHGVGSHLCVHEGPHQIRKDKRPCTAVALRPGMTVTDEPGIYIEGSFGVRLENVLLVRAAADGFLEFEALTLCPFDVEPIIKELLTHEELSYLNAYHAEVRRRLLPLLTDEADKQWLQAATQPI